MISSTRWEKSYFGGYKNILLDFPEIKTPFELDYEIEDKNKQDLGYYSYSKLMDLFHLRIKQFNLSKTLLEGAVVKEEVGLFSKKKYLFPSDSSVKRCISAICKKDTELGNLFDHYSKVISKSEIKYKLPDDDKKNGAGEGDGDGGPKEGNATEEERNVVTSYIDKIGSPSEKKGGTGSQVGTFAKKANFKLMPKGKKFIYHSEEVKYSNILSKMLDISFDPKMDRIDNLKTGKLDIAKIATVPAGNHHIYYKMEENQSTKPFSVCILMDESGSMGRFEKGELERAYKDMGSDWVRDVEPGVIQNMMCKVLYRTFSEVLTPDKLYIYGHSASNAIHEHPEIRIYNDKYNHTFEETIDQSDLNDWSHNYDGPVIEEVYNKVRSMTDDNILFISISDGYPAGHNYGGANAVDEMKRIIEKCKRDGFVTAGIGIHHSGVRHLYNYHTVVNDMRKMPLQVSNLLTQVVRTEFQD